MDVPKGELAKEDLEKVSGGTLYGYLFGGCWPWDHDCQPTGARIEGHEWVDGKPVTTVYSRQYKCTKCGDIDWT